MDSLTYDALCRQWVECLLEGDSSALEEELWHQILLPQGEFFPLAYVIEAFRLDTLVAKAFVLSLYSNDVEQVTQLSGGQLSHVFFCNKIGQRLPLSQLTDSLCFDPELLHQGLLRPAPRLLRFLTEEAYCQTGLKGLSLADGEHLPQSQQLTSLAQQMEGFLQASQEAVTFLLWGEEGAGRRSLATLLAQRQGSPLLVAELSAFVSWDGDALQKRLLQECRLMGCPVCLCLPEEGEEELWELFRPSYLAELSKILSQEVGYSFLCVGECWQNGIQLPQWRLLPVAVPLPSAKEALSLWQSLLANRPLAQNVDLGHPASSYRFTPGQMLRAIETAENLTRWRGLQAIDAAALAEGCRGQLRHRLGDKARRIEPSFHWEDLVLPEHSQALLRSACHQMQYRPQVLEDWGFGQKLPYGRGLSLLFSGPPGTGKTMGAQIVARQLGLELYKVDLATIVSKYVGETEKNLSIIFHEAQRSGAVLFFDEADALFGKRTEVKDAHDRYNNMEAAYLLQKIEEYNGVSVLATNYLQNIDDAFRRRITYIIEFPFPDAVHRLALWEKVFPAQTPLSEDIDWEFLASAFELSGSSIKNIALSAAFLAAGQGEVVSMGQILLAVRRDMEKSGKSLSKEDFGPYYMLLG